VSAPYARRTYDCGEVGGDNEPLLEVPLPGRLRDRLDPRYEFRMGVWRIAVELIDGSVINDLFTNGDQIYRLVGWSNASFKGERGVLNFGPDDIRDVRPTC